MRPLPRAEFRSSAYRTIKNDFFSVKTKKNQTGEMRVAVVAGKAVHKSAVRRNFLKRQARALFVAKKMPGMDVLVIVFPRAASLTRINLKKELSKIL
jgi:ribonuclease P protein component